jgi:hypothetical protein
MSEIRAADYDDLKYFYSIHKQIERGEINAANEFSKKGK